MAIEIVSTGRAIPPRRVSNDELATRVDTSDEWIRSHTGIGNRHIAEENVSCSDLAVEAAKNALAMTAGYTGTDEAERDRAAAEAAESIDFVLLATATPDFFGTPSTACLVQHRIGAKNAAALDITAGCTGFIYGLETAAGLLGLDRGRNRVLVIGSEILTRSVNWGDRRTCVLFGDGGGAVVVEKTSASDKGNERRGLVQTILKADGSGGESLLFRRGGTRNPFKKGEVIETGIYLEMNGQEVYNFAVKAIADTIAELMEKEGIGIDDIAWIVPHQANARIIQAARRRLKISADKVYLNIEEYANTSAASIPIALDEMNRNGQVKKGDLILTVGFGGGLTYGGNVLIW
ncbi:MAG: ketoacyl-ACP synthase III [Treponema sp.]|jgi:3-oxoacyl-[acyl-carrier-protein] synthase-3|nr:ketoacyl-ACP synthase III [Treponema sp.]